MPDLNAVGHDGSILDSSSMDFRPFRQNLIRLSALLLMLMLDLPPGLAQILPPRQSPPRPVVEPPQLFPPNLLEDPKPDPALPVGIDRRPLFGTERQQLQKTVMALDTQAQALLKAGKRPEAFQLWFRALRLRRYLGPLSEIQGLGEVGEQAWQENQRVELRQITERLQTLERQINAPSVPKPEQIKLKSAIAYSYQQVRAHTQAVTVYQQVLAQSKVDRDLTTQEKMLTKLAELYFNWLDYPQAAATYQELLTFVRVQKRPLVLKQPRRSPTTSNPRPVADAGKTGTEPLTEIEILLQLIFLYEQDRKFDQAIATQQQLLEIYQKLPDPKSIPAVKLASAHNYQRLNQMETALRLYQETYNLAMPLQQYGYAIDALQEVARYYRAQNQPDSALYIYQYLLEVNRQADSLSGQMETYDQMGQIYLSQKNYSQAIVSFNQGLVLARQLNFRQEYFQAQIQQATQQQQP
jgi:tetratricopeptide (TPR) repeat protein